MADLETPPVLRKKIAGVPVIVILGVVVLVLAVVAYRMRDTNAQDDEPVAASDDDQGYSDSALLAGSGDTSGYDAFVANGSITAAPADPADAADTPDPTNEEWVRKATEWLVTTRNVSGGKAQSALTKYIQGDNLTYEEGSWRDLAIRQFGVPPEPIGAVGSTGAAPAKRQGNPPTKHVVKGSSDDSLSDLAQLYYGRKTNEIYDLLQNANKASGLERYTPSAKIAAGTSVNIPKYTPPKYYTSTKTTNTSAEIARKNGISQTTLSVLNDGMKFPVKAGTRVRVG